MNVSTVFDTIFPVEDFSLEIAADRAASYDTVLFRGRRVADVEARIIEAQFRFPDGSTVLFLNDDEQFKELLTIMLVGPDLKVREQVRLGGAYTPGYFTYAYPAGPDELAFCWHDQDLLVTVRPHRRRFGLRTRWLQVREDHIKPPRQARAGNGQAARRSPTHKRRGRGTIPALAWLAWLRLRTARFNRDPFNDDRGPGH